MGKQATVYVDYQKRTREFQVDDLVIPRHAPVEAAGRVTAVWPAIGQLDVTFSQGTSRYPVEDLIKLNKDKTWIAPPHSNTIPGGAGSVSVPGGPYPPKKYAKRSTRGQMATRVIHAHIKNALYWHNRDRKYKATRCEREDGSYGCPRCPGVTLKPAIYKRENGMSVRLMGCPACMFLIRVDDIDGHPNGLD